MAKALKFAAIAVGAVALAFTGVGLAAGLGVAATGFGVGVSASTLFLVAGGLSVAAGLLQKAPKVTTSQTDRLTANIDPRTFRKTVLGQTAMPVDVRYEEWSGTDQDTCDWIVAFASHAIDGLDEIWFDTEMAWSATTGVVAKYNGYFSIPNLVLEGNQASAFTFASGKWNRNSARLTGCAYARFRFKVTGNGKKAESPFSSGIPSRITVIGRGAKLYDPRRDSTVPGGSGPMRWDDQSTWRFTTDDGVVIGENLPLQLLRVILGWRIRNPASGEMKLATGAGVPGRRISFPSFQVAANLADELVNRAAGGNEPRYHGAGVISEGDDQKTVLDMLCGACCGRFRDTGGKLALAISHNDLAAAATDDGLNDDDVVGAFTWDPDPSLEATPNVVRGRYVDASSASLYQLIDYPEVRLASPDGQDRFLSLDLGVVESASHAQRVAKQVLQRRQYSRQFAAPFDIRAWKYGVGDVLPFTFAPLAFRRGLFRVKEQELGQNGTCNMVLTYETPAFYQWDADDASPVQGAEPIVYDSRNNPLILAIDEAATTANWDGVTGTNKPADNATNSADPDSPFGTGTVSEFEKAVAEYRAQLAELDETTIPAINSAVSEAYDRIAHARELSVEELAAARTDYQHRDDVLKAGTDEVASRVDATENALADLPNHYAAATRAAALEAKVNGDEDSRLLARANDRAAVIADQKTGAVAQSVQELSASIGRSGGNVLKNSNFITTDGWTFATYSPNGPMTATPAINAAGDDYHPTGENVLSMMQGAATGGGAFCDWNSDPFPAFSAQPMQFYAFINSHRADVDIFVVWQDATGKVTGSTPSQRIAGQGALGKTPENFTRIGMLSVRPPAGTSTGHLVLRKYDTNAGQSSSFAWFWRPYGGEAREGQNSWNPYAAGTGAASEAKVSATLVQQAGVLAGLDGRSSVYWSVTGTTGDGSTRIQLSKASGQTGLFYVEANMLLAGNLVVDGTITARKFDRTSMAREGSASWQGLIIPDLGQTVTVPWGLTLSQVPALGRFVYELQIGLTSNAGQQQQSTVNGKPGTLTFVEAGGGLTIVAVDNQGNQYRPVANSWTTVLATTDFVPSWTARITRGSYDTGWVNNGDTYERQIAAVYSVSFISLKAMWVAI